MQGRTVPDLARGIGRVVHAKTYDRIVAGQRTLAYVNPRKDAVQLDFRTADVADAPAKLRKPLNVKGDRARLTVRRPGKPRRGSPRSSGRSRGRQTLVAGRQRP